MSTERAGASTFWTTITDLLDTELVSHDSLYTRGIQRLSDRGVWLRDEITRRTTAYAATALGTPGKVTGSVDLSGLSYADIGGVLNGLTLQVQSDTSGVITVTFGSGVGLAASSAGTVVSQINTATGSNPIASVDSAGKLSIASVTSGGSGVVTIVGGSAVATLGFTVSQTATGASTGGDGLSQVGGAAITTAGVTVSAGTLRAMLTAIIGLPRLSAIIGANGASVTRMVDVPLVQRGGTWLSTGFGATLQTNVATTCTAIVPLDATILPHGATLTSVAVGVLPAVHAALPAVMPTVAVWRVDAVNGSAQIGSTATDSSANFTAYNLQHNITCAVSHVVDRSLYRYYAEVTTESSTNAASGAFYSGGFITYTAV